MRLIWLFIFFILLLSVHAQQDTVSSDFRFNEGIYLTFDEFKSNSPSIEKFTVKTINGGTYFEFPCEDSTGTVQTCTAENVWGYCKGKNVFMHQGEGALYFRLQVIGALIHFYAIDIMYVEDYNYRYGYPYSTTYRKKTESEKIMLWVDGSTFYFNYKNFASFLKSDDPELYDELQNSKKKRKMIYFFMLKYNKKHPVFIENSSL